jgi:hypothetical protein
MSRETPGWLAVGAMIGGLVLGGLASLAVFHQQVARIVEHWTARPGGF